MKPATAPTIVGDVVADHLGVLARDLTEVVARFGDSLEDALEVPGKTLDLGDRAAGQRAIGNHALECLGVCRADEPDPVAGDEPNVIGSHRSLVGGSRPQCDRHQLDACAA